MAEPKTKYDRQLRYNNITSLLRSLLLHFLQKKKKPLAISPQGQAALEKSSICLLNCGPTGSETLKNLVLGGVGSITVVDGSKVELGDLGNNFMVDESSVGKSKAKTVCAFLEELNAAVKAKYIEEYPEKLIESNHSFFHQFTLVVASQMSVGGFALQVILIAFLNLVEHSMVKLDRICRAANVMLVFARSYGLTGLVRISVKEHAVIESKPDHFLDDLRLNNPWPELRRFSETIDLDTSDPVVHKHTPYVRILIKVADEWAKTHNGNLPSTREEKKIFKDLIKAKMIASDEDNYKEAIEASFKVFAPKGIMIAVLKSTLTIFSSQEFIANEGSGEASLEGAIPDMTSSTELYDNLQKIYQAKAEADFHVMETYTKKLLKKIGRDPHSIPNTTIKSFCKNARKLKDHITFNVLYAGPVPLMMRVCRYRTIEDEYSLPVQMELQNTAVGFYILLRAVDRFAANYNNFPGQFDGGMDEDIFRLKTTAEDLISEICRYGASELHAVAAFIGGIASQEVIKLITKQFVPLSGTFIFNGVDHKSQLLL
ncbi:NEDD8-activating enzyme E1 regulatory subunit [Striga asiatica]|uniref:NEDD8-activating enzyme E1 regulatory subunit n=1 Tax=Striga asiatica TaxID=4170 RepID=A0A5A7R747_STRAF|nr:NEDD8-activating enzyme E1 regulatory subunit [Striga asiatica]